MRIDFDFGDLEAFLAVKETGSFHAAAETLNLSQSAITRRLAKLEQALDTQLFERTTRSVKPTLAAKRLQARAEEILAGAHETTRAMRDETVAVAHQKERLVTVATLPTLVSRLVLPALTRFRADGKVARLRILDESANRVAEAVAGGDADFGLCSLPALEPATLFEPLFDDRVVLVLPKQHPLAGRHRVSLRQLTATPLILPARGTGNRVLIDEAMARARTAIHWAMEVGRSTTAIESVLKGFGAALLPETALTSPLASSVACCVLDGLNIARPVGLLSRAGQVETASVTALKSAIRLSV
ncbi:MAG: LysR family transcriptional regulator [Rhodospirillales bacterium]|nr:LysR family transcriptional regulator [Rhodospirillales bacterium]